MEASVLHSAVSDCEVRGAVLREAMAGVSVLHSGKVECSEA